MIPRALWTSAILLEVIFGLEEYTASIDAFSSIQVSKVPTKNVSRVWHYPLPAHLDVLRECDPDFQRLKKSAEEYALHTTPGKGGILDYQIVRTTKAQPLHRVWGGPARQCGYWWTLPRPKSIAPDGKLTLHGLMEAQGVCPEWNNGTFLETCVVPANYSLVVGQGNSATCQWGNTLFPPAALLQANGDVCSAALHCSTCNLRTDFYKCWATLQAEVPVKTT